MSNNQKQRSATERLADLEQAMMSLYQTIDNMARDLLTVKEAIKLLGNKTSSIAKVGGFSDEAISAVMIENNVADLKAKVDDLIAQGLLVAEAIVTENSFVVGRESDDTGKVINPRIQFVVSALSDELKAKFAGAGTGQTLDLQEGKLKFEVLESYLIQTPTAPEAVAEAAAPAEAPAAEAAPATEAASS